MKQPRRAKLALCLGLLAVAVGVAVAFRSPSKPVEIRFVGYRSERVVGVWFTNHSPYDVTCEYLDGGFFLAPHEGGEGGLLIPPEGLSNIVIGVYSPPIYGRLHQLLDWTGLHVVEWPRVVSFGLPPRPAAPFLGPTNQNTP